MSLKIKEKISSKYPISFSLNLLLAGWCIIIAGIAAWSYKTIYDETKILARREAFKGYEKDIMFRSWASMHGGVYVPVSPETQPNPFLSNIPDRDITTPSNKQLTLMNPAYMNRQINELSYKKLGIMGHITSLNPIRKENSPDQWETEALKSFEQEGKEFYGFDNINNEKYFRYMAPLVAEQGCLKCHATQGYKLGDIRGGISSSIPWKNYEASINTQTTKVLLGYGILWLIGFVGISLVKRRFIIYITRRDLYENEMRKLNDELSVSKNTIEESLKERDTFIDKITKANEELLKTNSEKDKFFSIIAHDLRSPFQGFVGLTEIFAEGINDFPQEELAKLSKEMNVSANNLYKLLRNLLDWAKMQQDRMDFNPAKINLHEIVSQNIEISTHNSGKKGITIFNEIPKDQTLVADEAMLNSILRNLLSNAVKFTPKEGSIYFRCHINDSGMTEISVTDTGIGMCDDLLNKLFKIEEKVGRIGTNGEPSTGLGLLLSKEFVEKHGGTIWALSEEGKGSTFYFTIPN